MNDTPIREAEEVIKILGAYKVVGDTTFGLGYKDAQELAKVLVSWKNKHTERAVLKAKAEEHELVYDKSVQLSFEAFCTWSDDRIKTLKTQLEGKDE